MSESRKALITATIDLVAEDGFINLTTRKISKRAGVSTGLLYDYFSSKEDLLFECFREINSEVFALFDSFRIPENMGKEDQLKFIRKHWETSFRYMLNSGNKGLFYYQYIDAEGLIHLYDQRSDAFNTEILELAKPYVDGMYQELQDEKACMNIVWTVLVNGTGSFVKAILRKRMKFEDSQMDVIWRSLTGGLESYT